MRYWGSVLLLVGLGGCATTPGTDATAAAEEAQPEPVAAEAEASAEETLDESAWPEVSEADVATSQAEAAAAKSAFDAGDFEVALAKADAALAMNYAAGDAWVYRGLALEQQGKYQEALEVLSTVSGEPEIADSDLGPLVAEAEGRVREAAAESSDTRAIKQSCIQKRRMSEAETVRYLNAISTTLSQANKCVGSIRSNCHNWSAVDRARSFSSCWGVVTKAAKIPKADECAELAPGYGFKMIWIVGQGLYLWNQMELLETECPQ